jgi:hypothetical protein
MRRRYEQTGDWAADEQQRSNLNSMHDYEIRMHTRHDGPHSSDVTESHSQADHCDASDDTSAEPLTTTDNSVGPLDGAARNG